MTALEPGVDQPTVDIAVDGEPIDQDEDEDKPGSAGSKRSKGTAENKSDFDEENDGPRKSTLENHDDQAD